MNNQGRFKVHGKRSVLLDTEGWIEEDPLPATKAHQLLSELESRVEENHQKDHTILAKEEAFGKTHNLIDRVAENKGHGPYKWSWPKPSRKDQRRVDTEIIRGRAFV